MTHTASKTIFFDAYDTIVTFDKTPGTNNTGIYAQLLKEGDIHIKSDE